MPFPARMLTYRGENKPLAEWAKLRGVSVQTIRSRLDVLGWTVEAALDAKADPRFKPGGRPRGNIPRPAPTMRHDKAKDRAFSRWQQFGCDHVAYFGKWGSEEAAKARRLFEVEWANGTWQAPRNAAGLSVAELGMRFLDHAERTYRKGNRETTEVGLVRITLKPLNELFGSHPAAGFTPANLRSVRSAMIESGWVRKSINAHCKRLIRMFSWAVGQSLIPPAVVAALREVESLKAGRTSAPDRPPVQAATDAQIEAVLPHLSPIPDRCARLAAMIEVQRRAGMRPGEVAAMRVTNLDRSGEVWIYIVADLDNKTLHLGKRRKRYFLGPLAQAAITPYLAADGPIFGIDRQAYAKAVKAACRKAGVPAWHPHQLRHALATEVGRRFASLDHAASAIGDHAAVAAAVYLHVDPDERRKIEVARAMG